MSAQSSPQTSKPSLASFRYREKTLASANIEIDEITRYQLPPDLYNMVEEMVNFSNTVPANTPMAERYIARHEAHRVATQDQSLAGSLLIRANTIAGLALEFSSLPESRWTDAIKQGLAALFSDTNFAYMQDAPWNATEHPLPTATGLTLPKPDFAVGYRATAPKIGNVATVSVWSRAFIATMEEKAGLYLVSHVANSQAMVLYPFFAFEAKSALGASFGAANQLSISLSYALGRMRQLRTDATGHSIADRLYLFGAISSGPFWNVYVAYEADTSAANIKCVLVRIWLGDIMDPHAALEFVWIIERIRQWAVSGLKPILTGWLESLRLPA